jgi:hypothetical protein
MRVRKQNTGKQNQMARQSRMPPRPRAPEQQVKLNAAKDYCSIITLLKRASK